MIPDWPLRGDGQVYTGDSLILSGSVSVSASVLCGNGVITTVASPLFASTKLPSGASGLLIHVWNLNPNGSLVQLYFGLINPVTAANALIPNLIAYPQGGTHGWGSVYYPIAIPPGVALYVAGRSSLAGVSARVTASAVTTGFRPSAPLSIVKYYGLAVDTANQNGVSLIPPATAGTFSTPVAVGGTVSHPISEMIIYFLAGQNPNRPTASYLVNIYRSSSTSDVILSDIPLQTLAQTDVLMPQIIGPIPVDVPVGTQMYASITSSPGSGIPIRMMIHGVS